MLPCRCLQPHCKWQSRDVGLVRYPSLLSSAACAHLSATHSTPHSTPAKHAQQEPHALEVSPQAQCKYGNTCLLQDDICACVSTCFSCMAAARLCLCYQAAHCVLLSAALLPAVSWVTTVSSMRRRCCCAAVAVEVCARRWSGAHDICAVAGATLVPQQGYWHSAPDSDHILPCPNSKACQGNTAFLLTCQNSTYSEAITLNQVQMAATTL